jgi:hypothetical protein
VLHLFTFIFCSDTENVKIKERIGLGKVKVRLNFITECCQHFVLGYTKNSLCLHRSTSPCSPLKVYAC